MKKFILKIYCLNIKPMKHYIFRMKVVTSTRDINSSNIKNKKENKNIELPSSPLDKRFTFDRFVVKTK